jgi:hypothetical protein
MCKSSSSSSIPWEGGKRGWRARDTARHDRQIHSSVFHMMMMTMVFTLD